MVQLSTPLVIAVVLAPLRHVPQVLASAEVIVFVAYPSSKDHHQKSKYSSIEVYNSFSFFFL